MEDYQMKIGMGFQIMGLSYAIVGTIGIVANLLVLQTFWKEKRKAWLHMQLAVVNILSLAIIIFIGPAALRGRFFFGDKLCQYTGFHAFLFGFAEINFTCLVCVECFVSLLHSSKYKDWMSNKVITGISLGSWVYSVVFAAAPLFGWGRYTYEKFGTSCGIDLNRRLFSETQYLTLTSVLFVILIAAAIAAVGVVTWKRDDSAPSSIFEPLITDGELVKISSTLLLILIVCSFPFGLRVLHYIGGWRSPFYSFLGVEFTHLAMKLSCALHPMAYFIFSERFQKKVKFMVTGIDPDKKNQ